MHRAQFLFYGVISKLPYATQEYLTEWLTEEMSESELRQITTWSTDAISGKVEAHLQELCPNLEALILDYKHL